MTAEEIIEFFKSCQIYCLVILAFKADICVSTKLITRFFLVKRPINTSYMQATDISWVNFKGLAVWSD